MTDLDRVKAISCLTVVGHYRTMVRQGGIVRALCVAHSDHRPSMVIYPDGIKCFACGFSEDAVGFVRFMDGSTFRDAVVKVLALGGSAPPVIKTERRSPISDNPPAPAATAELTFVTFCQNRKLNQQTLAESWRVRPETVGGRPALRYPTQLGIDRLRFLDGQKPKCRWAAKGGKGHWYGMGGARKVLAGRLPLDRTLYVVNGEPSVWACYESNVPAVCTLLGETGVPDAEMIHQIIHLRTPVRVVYDLDVAGAKGGARVLACLLHAGVKAAVLGLSSVLPKGGDVDDLHRRVGDRLAESLRKLEPKSEGAAHRELAGYLQLRNRRMGIAQSIDSMMRRAESAHDSRAWERIAEQQATLRQIDLRIRQMEC
jgi:DNA primase